MSAVPVAAVLRFPRLDGLRGLAALAVFVFHGVWLTRPTPGPDQAGWEYLHRVLLMGWSGVDVFFTLSAFLLSLPFVSAGIAGSPVALRTYFARRALRILPAYWVQLLLLGGLFAAAMPTAWQWTAHALLWLNIGSEPVRPLNAVWWTLPVEAGFYLLLPLLALLLRPGRWPWLLVLVVAAWGYRYQLLHAGLPRPLQLAWVEHLPGRIDQFAIGMLGAYGFVRGELATRLQSGRAAAATAMLAAVALLLVYALPFALGRPAGPGPSTHPALIAWHGYASLALLPVLWLAAAGSGPALGWLASAPWRWLGRVSYGWYLWHLPLMLAAREHVALLPDSQWRPLLFLLLLAPPSLLLAWLSWRWIERPALALVPPAATAMPRPA
jgi:peptidoglycan/LPS O-acetylase OafA/YrhL